MLLSRDITRRVIQSRRFNIRARSQPIRRSKTKVPLHFVLKRQALISSARRFGRRLRRRRRRCCFHPWWCLRSSPSFPPTLIARSRPRPFLSPLLSLPRGETLIQFHLPLADKLSHPCRNFPLRRFFSASRRRTIYNRNPPSRPPPPRPLPSPPRAARAKRFVLARREEERAARRNPYRL